MNRYEKAGLITAALATYLGLGAALKTIYPIVGRIMIGLPLLYLLMLVVLWIMEDLEY